MGVRELLAKTDGDFVSLRDAVSAIAKAEGVSFRDAAIALHRLLKDDDPYDPSVVWLRYSRADGAGFLGDHPWGLVPLRWMAENGDPAADWPELDAEQDLAVSQYGFERRDLARILGKHGIMTGLAPEVSLAAGATWPQWAQALAAQPLLTLREAAHAMAGSDPFRPRFPNGTSDDEIADVARWESALRRSVDASTLPCTEGTDYGGWLCWMLTPANFAAWCEGIGEPYPLPRPLTRIQPLGRPAAGDATTSAAEVEALRAELAELRAATAAKDAELSALREQVASQGTPAPPSPWPWGAHETHNLRALRAAAERHWVRFDPTDITTASTNDVVSAWIQNEYGVSARIADAMASILRPDGLKTGPR